MVTTGTSNAGHNPSWPSTGYSHLEQPCTWFPPPGNSTGQLLQQLWESFLLYHLGSASYSNMCANSGITGTRYYTNYNLTGSKIWCWTWKYGSNDMIKAGPHWPQHLKHYSIDLYSLHLVYHTMKNSNGLSQLRPHGKGNIPLRPGLQQHSAA